MNQTKALEFVASELVAQGLSLDKATQKIHQACLLATVEGLKKTLGPHVAPTPLYRIGFTDTNNLIFEFLDGKGKVPGKDTTDLEITDVIFASLASEKIPLLSEGITGLGKTYTLEHVLKTVYHKTNRRGLRLNANMSNVLQPYIMGQIDNGVLKVNINRDAAREVASLFIDEQNRGDTNAIIGFLDGQVTLATGETAELGLLIPQLRMNGQKVEAYYDGKVKSVVLHSAQNPSSAEYSGARSTDGAVGNRQIRVRYPNMALHSETLNMTVPQNGEHETFMDLFVTSFAHYLNLEKSTLESLLLPKEDGDESRANEEYIALHALSFDPRNSRNMFLKSAVEVASHINLLSGGEGLAQNFQDELEIAKEWTKALSQYKVNFVYTSTFDATSEVIRKIDGVRSTFSEPLIERDKTKAARIADALALITRYKQAYQNAREKGTSPLEEYVALQAPVTVRDIASAYTIVIQDKSRNGVSPLTLVKQAMADYVQVCETFLSDIYGEGTSFSPHDPDCSIRYAAAYLAVNAVKKEKTIKPSKMIDVINKAAAKVRNLDDGSDTKKLLIARINADLASFAGFIHEYQNEISQTLSHIEPGNEVLPRYQALVQVVKKARGDVASNYTLSHVQRIFGV